MAHWNSGFTQLENGGSFHSYVTNYQRVTRNGDIDLQILRWWFMDYRHITVKKGGYTAIFGRWFARAYCIPQYRDTYQATSNVVRRVSSLPCWMTPQDFFPFHEYPRIMFNVSHYIPMDNKDISNISHRRHTPWPHGFAFSRNLALDLLRMLVVLRSPHSRSRSSNRALLRGWFDNLGEPTKWIQIYIYIYIFIFFIYRVTCILVYIVI